MIIDHHGILLGDVCFYGRSISQNTLLFSSERKVCFEHLKEKSYFESILFDGSFEISNVLNWAVVSVLDEQIFIWPEYFYYWNIIKIHLKYSLLLILPAADTVGKYPHSYLKYLCNKSNAVSTGPQMSQNWCWVPRGMGGKKSVDCRDLENVVWRVHFWNYIKHICESQKFYLCFVF